MCAAIDGRLVKHYAEYDGFLRKGRKEFDTKWQREFMPNANIDDFQIMKTLGTGSFGRVLLIKHKQSNLLYAMKAMEKKHIIKTKQVDHTHSEIRIMDALCHDFLVTMQYYFKDNVYIYLTMQFINGGEMFTHLRALRKFDETMCKFYAGQIVLAFEYLHYLGLVYRDLKPENILIDKDGYLKVTDFGFCKKIDDQRTWTLCGTPEYLAPEVILSQGYNRSVDWWAIGILIYEMAAGFPPFFSKDPMRIYEKIVSGKYQVPQHFSKSLVHLLGNMIQVDRTKRFGILKNGTKDVKSHDWFKSLDWDALMNRRLKPSYKPKVAAADDVTNFDPYDEEPFRKADVEEYPEEFATIKVKHHTG